MNMSSPDEIALTVNRKGLGTGLRNDDLTDGVGPEGPKTDRGFSISQPMQDREPFAPKICLKDL
jgi:hypothetical protein